MVIKDGYRYQAKTLKELKQYFEGFFIVTTKRIS